MARLTFPDQQQDLQNAANASLASECGGSVKFRTRLEAEKQRETGLGDPSGSRSAAIWLPGVFGSFQRLSRERVHALGVVLEIHKPVTVVQLNLKLP